MKWTLKTFGFDPARPKIRADIAFAVMPANQPAIGCRFGALRDHPCYRAQRVLIFFSAKTLSFLWVYLDPCMRLLVKFI